MYLMIENDGVADISALTVFGHSTSRDDDKKIGNFGSGVLHSIGICLREGINLTMYLGKDDIKFFSEPRNGFSQICFFHKNEKKELSVSQDYGKDDWIGVELALREFISNAIDNGTNYKVEVVQNIEGKEGSTRIFIPMDRDVQKFVSELDMWFLHFSNRNSFGHIEKKSNGPVRVYRNGVFVREIQGKDSLFDYNFRKNELKLNEVRTLDDSTLRRVIGDYFSQNLEVLKKIFLNHDKKLFETTLSSWFWRTYNNKSIIQQAWNETIGTLIDNGSNAAKFAIAKGYRCTNLNEDLYYVLQQCEVKTASDILIKVEADGSTVTPATKNTITTFNICWDFIDSLGMTLGKKKPSVKCFKTTMNGGSLKMGYYQDNVIYINEDYENDKQTMLEEIAHHITGATDMSRDFQDYILKVLKESMVRSI